MGLPLMMERSSNNNNVVELSRVAVSDTHGEDSPYFAGWKAYDENPYEESHNPSGVIQMGLAENQVTILYTFINFSFKEVNTYRKMY